MPFGISGPEIVVILVMALVLLGPKRLPEAGRSVGRGLREFKAALTTNSAPRGDDDEDSTAASRAGG